MRTETPSAPLARLMLWALPLASCAAMADCPVEQITLPTERPAACLAIKLPRATVLLDKALLDAHAAALVMSHPDDAHLSQLTARRARELLQAATPRRAQDACAQLDAQSPSAEGLYYVALQIDRGQAAVQPGGTGPLTAMVMARERAARCSNEPVALGTRVYRLPDGTAFLGLVTSVS